jgi:hypothetical protein
MQRGEGAYGKGATASASSARSSATRSLMASLASATLVGGVCARQRHAAPGRGPVVPAAAGGGVGLEVAQQQRLGLVIVILVQVGVLALPAGRPWRSVGHSAVLVPSLLGAVVGRHLATRIGRMRIRRGPWLVPAREADVRGRACPSRPAGRRGARGRGLAAPRAPPGSTRAQSRRATPPTGRPSRPRTAAGTDPPAASPRGSTSAAP